MNSISVCETRIFWLWNSQHIDGDEREGGQTESLGGRGPAFFGTPWAKESHLPFPTAPALRIRCIVGDLII